MLKRISIALIMAGMTATAWAAAPADQVVVPTDINVTAADSTSAWSFGIEGIYARSTGPQFQYAQIHDGTNTNNQSVNPGYNTGLEVDGTYHFAGNSRDILVAYMHVSMNDSDSSTIGGSETFTDPFGLASSDVSQIKGKTYNNYNAIDVVMGQHFTVANKLDIHPFGGLRWGNTESRFNSTYYNIPGASSSTAATAEMDSEYKGLGPRGGVDAAYNFGSTGLSLVGTLGGSLLLGRNDAQTITQVDGDLPTTTKNDKDTYVVPELDAKVGLNLQHSFNTTASMNVEAGYMAENYFNAIENNYDDVSDINSVNGRQNFGFAGPYARFQLNLV